MPSSRVKHETGVLPSCPALLTFVLLAAAPGMQHVDGSGVEADGAGSRVRLRLASFGGSTELHHLLRDARVAGVEVDVLPLQTDRLPATKAPVRDEVEERVEAMDDGSVEEGAGLLRRPYGDRGPHTGSPPDRDAVLGHTIGSAAARSAARCAQLGWPGSACVA